MRIAEELVAVPQDPVWTPAALNGLKHTKLGTLSRRPRLCFLTDGLERQGPSGLLFPGLGSCRGSPASGWAPEARHFLLVSLPCSVPTACHCGPCCVTRAGEIVQRQEPRSGRLWAPRARCPPAVVTPARKGPLHSPGDTAAPGSCEEASPRWPRCPGDAAAVAKDTDDTVQTPVSWEKAVSGPTPHVHIPSSWAHCGERGKRARRETSQPTGGEGAGHECVTLPSPLSEGQPLGSVSDSTFSAQRQKSTSATSV